MDGRFQPGFASADDITVHSVNKVPETCLLLWTSDTLYVDTRNSDIVGSDSVFNFW